MPTYGGGVNPPVRLDPWQNIVEVGWNPVRWMACPLVIGRTATHDFQQHMQDRQGWNWTTTTHPAPDPTPPGGGWGNYVTSFRYVFGPQGVRLVAPFVFLSEPNDPEDGMWAGVEDELENPPITGFREWRQETWQAGSQPTGITGLPNLPMTVELAPEIAWSSARGDDHKSPRLAWEELGGSALPDVPPAPDALGSWRSDGTVTISLKGLAMADNGKRATDGHIPPHWQIGGSLPLQKGFDTEIAIFFDFNGWHSVSGAYPSTFHSLDITIGSLSWTRAGRTYQVIGAALDQPPSPNLEQAGPGTMWLLAELV